MPAILVLVFLQQSLSADRRERVAQDVLRQAELVNGDVRSVVEGARQLSLTISHFRPVRLLDPDCRDQLVSVQAQLPTYAMIAVLRPDGTLVCSTDGRRGGSVSPELREQLTDAAASGEFMIGRYLPAGARCPALLPFILPFSTTDGSTTGLVVAGLSLEWLGHHLAELRRPAGSTVLVADRQGVTLARFPDSAAHVGRSLSPEGKAHVAATRSGVALGTGEDGKPRMMGFVPAAQPPIGLYVGVGVPADNLTADIDGAARRGYLLISLGACASLALAMLLAHGYVRAPTARLLLAVRRFTAGDLSARAHLQEGPRTEFGSLAAAFNAMAEAQGRQKVELQRLNEELEARVADRTQALLDSNNKLQVAIAERDRTEASLRQAQKLQAVGQLAGGIAHDFNNLLTAIMGSLDMLRRRIPDEDARLQRLVDTAVQAVGRGSRLTAQLLSFSRKQRLLAVPTDLNATVAGMSNMLDSTLGRSIRVETRFAPALWPAMVDPNQLEAAILNLALNARDATGPDGLLEIETGNVVVHPGSGWQAEPGDYVALTVSDNGSGMSPDLLLRVFEPFFTTKPPGRGSGLGLSQVHGLVQQSGGDILIDSHPGLGTRVTLLLPRAESAALVAPAPRPDDRLALAGLRPAPLLLLVDDDADVREVTAEILAEAGYDVLTAEDGPAGLAIVRDQGERIRLLVADYAMPGMNGIELVRAARAALPELPVLMVTGYAEFGADGDLAGLSMDMILRKPFRPADLLRRIEMALEARQPAAA